MVHIPLSDLAFVYSLVIHQILSTNNILGGNYKYDTGKRSKALY